MKQRGGILLAISADEMEDSKALIAAQGLTFPILSAAGIPLLRDYGLEHAGGGPGGATIAVPAQILVGPDRTVQWQHVARRITDRAAPSSTLAAIEAHVLPRGP